MHRTDFRYDLPPDLIAQEPLATRSESRLLVLDRTGGALADERFDRLPSLLCGTELLVFNDTRVIAARLTGRKLASGGVIEILIERILDSTHARAQLRASKMPKPGGLIQLDDGPVVQVRGRDGGFFDLEIELVL